MAIAIAAVTPSNHWVAARWRLCEVRPLAGKVQVLASLAAFTLTFDIVLGESSDISQTIFFVTWQQMYCMHKTGFCWKKTLPACWSTSSIKSSWYAWVRLIQYIVLWYYFNFPIHLDGSPESIKFSEAPASSYIWIDWRQAVNCCYDSELLL